MEGDLEVRPRAECAACGRRVAPPVGPSFVYGIGAIGFQHCLGCGARWRCLWVAPRRRPVSARALVLIAATVLVLAAGAVAYASTRSSNEPELTSATHGGPPGAPATQPRSAAAERYLVVITPGNAARDELRDFLRSTPPATPRSELDRRVAVYTAAARRTGAALDSARWPKAAQAPVRQLIAANQAYSADLTSGVGMLNESAFGKQVDGRAAALHAAANRVRAAVGLRALGAPLDPRFPPL